MREYLDILTEAVGLANRRTGEIFKNPQEEEIRFQGITFYPDVGAFEDVADMQAHIREIERRLNSKIQFTNVPTAKLLAFAVVVFIDSHHKVFLAGRYFTSINSIKTSNYWPNSALPNGFKYTKASANKIISGLAPQDVLTNLVNQTPESILDQVVKRFGKDHPLSHLTNGIAKGQGFPISVDVSEYPDLNFEAFRDYFCEILQPLAVINKTTSGNADEAVSIFFGRTHLSEATITFDTGKTTGLYDSILTSSSGNEIKISTKGGIGAQASITNLLDAIADLKKAGNKTLQKEYQDVIDIIETVKKKGYQEGPLSLAVEFGIINEREADIVRALKTDQNERLTNKLQDMYNKKTAGVNKETIVPYYAMLTAIAYAVADHINSTPRFSQAASEILNNSALLQIYTDAVSDNGKFTIHRFRAVYPNSLVSEVLFSPAKNYFCTSNKGNFTFKIKTAGSTIDSPTSTDAPSAMAINKKKQDIATGASMTDIRPVGTPKLDREKRDSSPRGKRP